MPFLTLRVTSWALRWPSHLGSLLIVTTRNYCDNLLLLETSSHFNSIVAPTSFQYRFSVAVTGLPHWPSLTAALSWFSGLHTLFHKRLSPRKLWLPPLAAGSSLTLHPCFSIGPPCLNVLCNLIFSMSMSFFSPSGFPGPASFQAPGQCFVLLTS